MKHAFYSLAGLILAGCIASNNEETKKTAARFRYDGASGSCRDSQGKIGLNPYDSATVKGSMDAECVDLAGIEIFDLVKDTAAQWTDKIRDLEGWNFKGALFTGAKLHFHDIIDANLEGADFSAANFGYVNTTASVDKFTKYPVYHCTITGNKVKCSQ